MKTENIQIKTNSKNQSKNIIVPQWYKNDAVLNWFKEISILIENNTDQKQLKLKK